jgi:hypothetical protein
MIGIPNLTPLKGGSMRFSILVLTAALGMVAVGCSSGKPSGEAGQLGPEWSVTVKYACAETPEGQKDYCAGYHGLTVYADGTYILGDGRYGKQFMSEEHKSALIAAARPVVDFAFSGAREPSTQTGAGNAYPDDIITVKRRADAEKQVIQTNGLDVVFTASSYEEAEALHDAMVALVDDYYEAPFPSPCLDEAQKFNSTIAGLNLAQGCQTDTDCVYVDNRFSSFPPDVNYEIQTQSCTRVNDVVVVNSGTLNQHEKEIATGLQSLMGACSGAGSLSFWKTRGCETQGFFSNQAKAVCAANRCTYALQ